MTSIKIVAEQAARLAGDFIQQAASNISALHIEQKSLHDYVSEVDRGAEQIIVKTIRKAFPDHRILGEEYGLLGESSAEYHWVVDPLDGTTNFLRSIPHYAVSIAVLRRGELVHAVVFDPAKNDFFYAGKGQGAYLNGDQISVSNSASIQGALLATGVPFSGENLAHIDSFTKTMVGLLECQTSGIRRLGAAALDLAYVAAGRYDGFWEANLQTWDIAAGALLVSEAGGKVSGLQGDDRFLQTGHILAANVPVHGDMLKITSSHYTF